MLAIANGQQARAGRPGGLPPSGGIRLRPAVRDAEEGAGVGGAHRRPLRVAWPVPRPVPPARRCGPRGGPGRRSACPPSRPAGGRPPRAPRTGRAAWSGRSRSPTSVAPGGSAATAAASVATSPGMPPGTPMTRSQCTWPPAGGPNWASSRCRVATCPRSNSSNSGTTWRSWVSWYRSLMNGHGLANTSSPKLTVPQVSEQASGRGVQDGQPVGETVGTRRRWRAGRSGRCPPAARLRCRPAGHGPGWAGRRHP